LSRNQDRIRKALAARGWRAEELTWEPIGANVEMQGPSGGWLLRAEPANEAVQLLGEYLLAYNVESLLEEIETYLPDLTV
jgi:hypothetical protein